MKNCRICHKEINDEANKCPYCQSWQGFLNLFLHSFFLKSIFILGLFVIAILVGDKLTSPSEWERASKTKVSNHQLDSIIVLGMDWMIDKNECYDKRIIGNLNIHNKLNRELEDVYVQIEIRSNDSLKYAYIEHVYANVAPNINISTSVSEPIKILSFISFDTVIVKVVKANFGMI